MSAMLRSGSCQSATVVPNVTARWCRPTAVWKHFNAKVDPAAPLHVPRAGPLLLGIVAARCRRSQHRRLPKILNAAGKNGNSDPSGTTSAEQRQKKIPSRKSPSIQDAFYYSFLSPKIEDPALVLQDVLLSGVAVPALLILICIATSSYVPRWLVADLMTSDGIYTQIAQGSLLMPTLKHGAGLSLCWIVGVLSVRGFQGAATSSRDLGATLMLTSRAGFVAALLWWLGMLLQLQFLGIVPDTFGQCAMTDRTCLEADAKVIQYYFDATLDIGLEALVLTVWRLSYALSRGPRP